MKKTKVKKNQSRDDVIDAEPAVADSSSSDQVMAGQVTESSSEEATGPVDPLVALQERVASLEDALVRAKADYQNLQRRSATQQADAVRYANADMMKSLIVVADDFDRALAANEIAEDSAALAAGMKLVHDNLIKALRDHGLEYVPALHQPFDPAQHEALLQQPTDAHEPGTVVEEVAKGYRLRDRVIRPAKVVVSKAKDVDPEAGDA